MRFLKAFKVSRDIILSVWGDCMGSRVQFRGKGQKLAQMDMHGEERCLF